MNQNLTPTEWTFTEVVRKYAAEQQISEDEALDAGMAEKSKEFAEKGSELYAKACLTCGKWLTLDFGSFYAS